MGTFEECPLGTDFECKFIAAVRLDFADLSNQLDDFAPGQISRQFAGQQTLLFLTGHPYRIRG